MRKKMLHLAAAAVFLLLLLPLPAQAAKPLDEIKNYVITVDMRQDGTMDIQYQLDWLVLDDMAEGPLTWVKIGIPNRHVDNIKALTPNISNIGYMGDGGSYVRIDLDRAYRAGETVSFGFSIHQSYMYTLGGMCAYSFTPGWFDGIQVDSLKVLWNKEGVASSNAMGTQGEYLTWETSLDAGERYKVSVDYPMGVLDTAAHMQAEEGDGPYEGIIASLTIILVGAVLIGFFIVKHNGYKGGFGQGGTHGPTHRHSCAGCACACACACAGGGRAGCSVKHFYGAGVPMQVLREKLK